MASRTERLEKLKEAVKDFAKKEKERIENEVASLESILKGRTGGQGVQELNVAIAYRLAQADLDAFLRGD